MQKYTQILAKKNEKTGKKTKIYFKLLLYLGTDGV